jgi:D-alanyl-D-alanine carboxypeptidase
MLRIICYAPLLAAGLGLAALPGPERQDESQTALARRASALASAAIQHHGASGLSIVVEVAGRSHLEEGYGFAGWEPDVRADADTSYRVAPLLGHFLSVAVLRLVQDEELGLEDPLERLLPELREEPWPGVQLRHLLEQTSGIPSYERHLGRREFESFPQAATLEWLSQQGLDDEPGTCFEPNPSNLLLLGLILEAQTGRSVQSWTQEQLFAPIGLDATHWCWTGRGPRPRGGQQLPFGAEGLCTSAADMARWVRALVEGTLLDARHFELLTSPARLLDGTWIGAGMGMTTGRMEDLRRHELVSSYAGSHLALAYYPEADLTTVVMATGDAVPLSPIEQSLARAALGLPEPGLQDLELSPEEQGRYVGGYMIGCNRVEIVSAGERLSLETSEGHWASLLYQGKHRFVSREDPGLSLLFHLDTDARATSFILERHGTQTQARRVDLR